MVIVTGCMKLNLDDSIFSFSYVAVDENVKYVRCDK